MRVEEFIARLNEMGAYVTPKTLRDWGQNGIIEDHVLNIGENWQGKCRRLVRKSIRRSRRRSSSAISWPP